MRFFTFLFLFLTLSFASFSQLVHDESYSDMDFWLFKQKLEQAVIHKNQMAFKDLLADTVWEGHFLCGECSKDAFMQDYFGDGKAAHTWKQLLNVIRFGFSKIQQSPNESFIFKAPSYLDSVDTENELIILGENVNIRAKAGTNSEVIHQASYEKFKCDCNITTNKDSTFQFVNNQLWVEIYVDDQTTGYVLASLTSQAIYKRMTVKKIDGTWKITSFYNPPGC
ncbi:MAG: SH3 domain-containing protein [Flammeovirgaceae bacterium]